MPSLLDTGGTDALQHANLIRCSLRCSCGCCKHALTEHSKTAGCTITLAPAAAHHETSCIKPAQEAWSLAAGRLTVALEWATTLLQDPLAGPACSQRAAVQLVVLLPLTGQQQDAQAQEGPAIVSLSAGLALTSLTVQLMQHAAAQLQPSDALPSEGSKLAAVTGGPACCA